MFEFLLFALAAITGFILGSVLCLDAYERKQAGIYLDSIKEAASSEQPQDIQKDESSSQAKAA